MQSSSKARVVPKGSEERIGIQVMGPDRMGASLKTTDRQESLRKTIRRRKELILQQLIDKWRPINI
jgi:hypothetical protein